MKRLLVLATTASLVLSGCGAGTSESRELMAGFYPLQFVTETLADEPVGNLTQPGVEPHDLDLKPRARAELESAELIVRLDGFQPAVDKVAKGKKSDLDIAAAADLVDRDGTPDPHFWQDPSRLASVADAVAARLTTLRPKEASAIESRLADLKTRLAELDASYAAGLKQCATRTVVVNHEAFGYLSKYDLELVSYAGLSPDAEPSAAQIARMQKLIRDKGVTTVYGEVLVENRGLSAIAKDLDLEIAELDPVEGPHSHGDSDDHGHEHEESGDYFELMQANLAALKKGLQCR